MSRRELADKVGTSPGQIQKLEKGERGLDQRWMERLSIPLKVHPGDLIAKRAVDMKLGLKALRKRAGLTPAEVARELGIPTDEYVAYEEKRASVPTHLNGPLANVFATKADSGQASVTLAGIERGGGQAEGVRAERPRATALSETVMIPHLDVHASAGAGAEDPTEVGEGQVIGQWQIPADIIRQFAQGAGDGLYWITNRGNSMEPVIAANTPVLVNTKDRRPSPPGVFCLWDGIALVIKNVQAEPFSSPVKVKISSANPAFDPYERTEDEAYIWGRVVANMRAT